MAKKANSRILLLGFILLLLLTSGCQNGITADPSPTESPSGVNISVKFSEGTNIRLRDGELVSLSNGTVPKLSSLFDEYRVVKI